MIGAQVAGSSPTMVAGSLAMVDAAADAGAEASELAEPPPHAASVPVAKIAIAAVEMNLS